MTYDEILRAYAFGQISADTLRALCVEYPMLKRWLKSESRRLRNMAEANPLSRPSSPGIRRTNGLDCKGLQGVGSVGGAQ